MDWLTSVFTDSEFWWGQVRRKTCFRGLFRLIPSSEHPALGVAPSPSRVFTCSSCAQRALLAAPALFCYLLSSATSSISGCLLDGGGSRGCVFQVIWSKAFTFLRLPLVAAFEARHYFVFAPLFDLEVKGLGFLTRSVEQTGWKARNSFSVPTLPCCLGIWPLSRHIYFSIRLALS